MGTTTKGAVTRISLAIEIGGKPHFVALSQSKLLSLLPLACALSENGRLPVVAAPDEFKFCEVKPAAAKRLPTTFIAEVQHEDE